MSDTVSSDAVQTTLQKLSHLSLQVDELFEQQGQQIGCGGYGEVILATLRKPNEKEALVAVKCVWAVGTSGDRHRFAMRFARELQVWGSVRHLNVLPLLGFYLSDNYAIAKLVSPYMSKGNVTQYISREKPGLDKRVHFVLDIAAGVDFLHNHHPPICHGDLKPANVLVSDNDDAVLCDFGLASVDDAAGTPSGLTTSRSIKGSIRYMSPELLLRNDGKHCRSSDVWAWGCTAFEIFTGYLPYSAETSEARIILALDRGERPGAFDNTLVADWTHRRILDTLEPLILLCWSFESIQRPRMSYIVEALSQLLASQGSQGVADVPGLLDIRLEVHADPDCPESLKNDTYVKVMLNGKTQGTIQVSQASDPAHSSGSDHIYVVVRSFRQIPVIVLSGPQERIDARLEIDVRDLITDHMGLGVHHIVQDQTGVFIIMVELRFDPFGDRNFPTLDNGDRTLGEMSSTARSHLPSSQGWTSSGTPLSILSEGGTYYTARSNLSSYQMSMPGGFHWGSNSFK